MDTCVTVDEKRVFMRSHIRRRKNPSQPVPPRNMRSRNQQATDDRNVLHEQYALQTVLRGVGSLHPEVVHDERERDEVDQQQHRTGPHPVTQQQGQRTDQQQEDGTVKEEILVPGQAVDRHRFLIEALVSEVVVRFKKEDEREENAAEEIKNIFHRREGTSPS